MIRNVHARELAAPAAEVGALLDSLASDDDRLWPTDWPPVRVIHLVAEVSGDHARGRRRRVPCPVRARAQREPRVVRFEERLEAGDVGRKGELAVADGQRRERIDRVDNGIMSADQRPAIDRVIDHWL